MLYLWGKMTRTADFSETRRKCYNIFQMLKEKNCQPRIQCQCIISFRNEEEIRTFSDKEKIKSIYYLLSTLKGWLKPSNEIPWTVRKQNKRIKVKQGNNKINLKELWTIRKKNVVSKNIVTAIDFSSLFLKNREPQNSAKMKEIEWFYNCKTNIICNLKSLEKDIFQMQEVSLENSDI